MAENYGASKLCSICVQDLEIDDTVDDFHEDVDSKGDPTLHFKPEKDGSKRLPPVRKWDDVLPDYPAMQASAQNGCELCDFVRRSLIRRGINGNCSVTIKCGYVWGANRDELRPQLLFARRSDGLTYMRCEVFRGDEQLAYIIFPIEATSDGWILPKSQ